MSDLDETALEQWLRTAVPALSRIDGLEKFAGGQSNPTYRLDSDAGPFVLRRKPFGKLLPSAHAIEREYRLLTALRPTGFPVPAPVALCEDPAIIGSAFYLMELVEGRNLTDGALPSLPAAERREHYMAMIDTQAALHAIDHEAVGLGDFGASGNYAARQVERWTKQYRASQTDEIPEVDRLMEWLPRTLPEQVRSSVIHGDYRIDNLIFDPVLPKVNAVLDWELATIGDPLADFAYLAMNWIMPYEGRAGLDGLDLTELGLPTLDEVVERYCAAAGRDSMPDLHWYFAFNLFRLACILQGVKKRIADGNASSAHAAQMVKQIIPLAQAGWAEARKAGAGA